MTHIQQRRDTAATWTSVNPVLYEGEAGHETDTGKWKLGDGVTAWTALPYKAGVDSVAGRTGDVSLNVNDVAGAAPLAGPTFTGTPSAPTPATSTDSTRLATTEFVHNVLDTSPVLAGNPTAPTPATADSDTSIATTAFVKAALLAIHPVDSLYFNTANVNPSTFLGGTWQPYAAGRMIVGVDTGATPDPDFDTAGETGGAKTVTLTAAQSGLPESNVVKQANSGPNYYNVAADTDPTHRSTLVGPAPASQSHQNMPPYITAYIFKRTA